MSTRLPLLPGRGTSDVGTIGPESSPEEVVVAYHERTKHHFHRYAASRGALDWASQPDPFRRFSGAELLPLGLPALGETLLYSSLYDDSVSPHPLELASLSKFFRYALSLTAWKAVETSKWALRANPSSGNLHPTEGYTILPAIVGLADTTSLYHYAPKPHALERRARLNAVTLAAGTFVVGLSSVHWREAWKYGERAYRYCQHDVGHAIACLRFAAAALGWRMLMLKVGDDVIARVLGLDRDLDFDSAERETPDVLALVGPQVAPIDVSSLGTAEVWFGRANVLSAHHGIDWPIIDTVSAATHRTTTIARAPTPHGTDQRLPISIEGAPTAEHVILGRRSAVAMDGTTSISRETFYRMMARLLPEAGVPWDAIDWRPRIHLGLFVHRVRDLDAGLYVLVRDPEKIELLKQAMRPEFHWTRAPETTLPLFLLQPKDCRALAATVSCGQEIAGDGAFSLGMLADYLESLKTDGAPFYKNLFWEAGMVGQVLYLEAEAAGVRATGIGCYFDDPVHDVFGLTSRDWQSFYHFTVGGPVDDARLTTLPAYETEQGSSMTPKIILTPEAAKALQEAARDVAGADLLRITISRRFEHALDFGPRQADDVEVFSEQIAILLDPDSASRADGMSIDFIQAGEVTGFRIQNPNAPPKVKPISPQELNAMISRGAPLELVDVRTVEERAIARIEGSKLLDDEALRHLSVLDPATVLVFQCHHGVRSMSAAEHFIGQGFKNVYNLTGGIDAWSLAIDPRVPRY